MPYVIYVYSQSDFVQPLPAEASSGNFSGTLPYTVTLRPGATPTRVEITDNDLFFHEVDPDGQQVLTQPITLDGTPYAAGTTVNSAYDLTSTDHSMRLVTLHFGGDGFYAGPVHGLVSTEPMVPGQPYTFNRTVTSNSVPLPYDQISCFASGTRIATDRGEIAVELLEPGHRIATRDHGFQTLRQRLCTTVPARDRFAPVVLRAGLFGNQRKLVLSPQHRILITSARAELLFGEPEVLVAATHLAEVGLANRVYGGEVTYHHLALDRHEIIFAEGAPVESFLPQSSVDTLSEAAAELRALFPETARLCLREHEAAILLAG